MRNIETLVHVPSVLTERPQWCGFKIADERKTPLIADAPSRKASSTDRTTWRPFDIAVAGLRQGLFDAIAYALDADFVGIDLDDCFRIDELTPEAVAIVRRCNSYTERSFSGRGVHILLHGTLPDRRGRRLHNAELYDRKRFLITTGDRLPNTPEEIRTNPVAVTWLLEPRNVTERPETTETTEAICSAVSPLSTVSVTLSVDEVLSQTLPMRPGERNGKVLDLARGLRFNADMAGRTFAELKPLVRRWHETALPVIETKEFTETWTDFVYAWPRARLPLGFDVLSEAWKRSQSDPPPVAANEYDSEPARQLVSLCAALARLSPDSRFFLSTRDAARLIGKSATQAGRWFEMFVADNVLQVEHVGNEHRATRYRWIAQDTNPQP